MHRHVGRFLLCLAALVATPAHAQDTIRVPGADLTVYLATIGPGEQVWEKWGHNAIWIRDLSTGTTASYNYGVFSFRQADFVPRLMKGRMLYAMGVNEAEDEVSYYASVGRSVTVQRLNLTDAQRHALREFLEWNWLPQHRNYLYDYFRDNCSTRVRDALDRALGGRIRTTLAGEPTGTTFRSHSLRLTADDALTYTGLMLGLGRPTDRLIDAWEETFVPMLLMEHMRTVQVTGPDGRAAPLVAEEYTSVPSRRPPPAEQPPQRVRVYLVIGLLLGAGLLLLALRPTRRTTQRVGLALGIFFWGVCTGFLGLLLALLWLLTDHTAAYPNLNLLQVNPLGLLLAIAGPFAVLEREEGWQHRSARLAFPAALVLAALSAAGLAVRGLAGLEQVNGPIIALALPVHLAVVLCLYQAARARTSSEEDASRRIATPTAA